MREFEIVDTVGFLGQIRQVPSTVEKYRARLEGLLEKGVSITSVAAAVTSTLSTASAPAESANERNCTFTITTTATVEEFTLTLTVVTTDGQTLKFFLLVEVASPLS
mgnify:CR=1 FL=1